MPRSGPGSRRRTTAPVRCSTPCPGGPICTTGSARCCGPDRRWPARSRATGCSPSSGGGTTTRPSSSSAPRCGPVWPAAWSTPWPCTGDPTAAIDWYHPSPDGRLVAYGLSTGGDERSTLHVLDVESGRMLTDTIPDTRGASVAWAPTARASPTRATRTRARCPTTSATTGARSSGTSSAPTRPESPWCGTTCPTRRRGPTCRCRPTVAGCWCTCRSAGAGSTST